MLSIVPYLLCLFTAAYAEITTSSKCSDLSIDGCLETTVECKEVCGCDRIYKFDQDKGECVVDFEVLKELTSQVKHYPYISEKLRETNERVFLGVIGSAVFVICCASFGIVSVCLFCCHMHYVDGKLKSDVKALKEKLKRTNNRSFAQNIEKHTLDPINESCNVLVADADIMCV